MAAGLAHEMNTPLANIRALAALARKELTGRPEHCQVAEDLDDIIQQTDRCSKILSGLLSFAREQEQNVHLHDLNSVCESAMELVKIKAEKQQVNLQLLPAPEMPPVSVDRHQMEQVLVNLLLNAIDAVQEGGQVFVSLEHSAATVTIRVRDDGCGIPDDVLPRIFDPFFTTKEIGKGTGLGLSLSYGIIKSHGGSLDVRSTPGKGSEFVVTLPLPPKQATP